MGNSMHDELFDRHGVNVTLEDALDAAGSICLQLAVSSKSEP